ncbi:hypothetical protein VAE151_510002 [Vibrio aestuarianus]|uniref:Uncharacterized protein n=1 Tax=Vibrio aestuarianus TaxID=28171 RepID=A0ABN8TNP7_9VIBR|nr:hypothetical protein VAE308_1000002 [Vibrio aestuarianus]CAH8184433.1 hypothetical protein VAE032_230002 [Vibrio aestuarianus]CAH8184495.1 hypothetical protein VAE055_330002 [Vibrio aestuarianus]CAH8184560.1 hypothetical protein VAE128_430002 [Vibrio aestuarianus]CAH8184585.1 hypothetical protein VAE130_540002 [Vibrio aestuarianus]
MMRVRFPLPAPTILSADIAQSVERTLGKGEVPSSNLGISTSSLSNNFLLIYTSYQ